VGAQDLSPDRSTGRVAVITGASSGIGEATARALAADGHRVALLARRLDRIQAVAEELFDGRERDEHRRMVETNLLGAMTATEVFLEQLRDGGGDLVNISSVAGRVAPAGFAVYAATKWGMNGWSESLRLELQPDVRVILIEPGAVATELTGHITHAESKRAAQEATSATHIEAEDIAEVIAFAVGRPQRVAVSEILVRPTAQAL
jgi:NADP-dependent 3-hydroxy acid dehydrogenase YdfG